MRSDPYTPEESYHDCIDCGTRVGADEHDGLCPECGGAMRNLSVTRE